MNKINILLFIVLLGCTNSNTDDNIIETASEYVIKSDLTLYKNDLRNKFIYPCKKINTILPESIQQLPGSNYYFFNERIKKTSITLQCKEESAVYPIGVGVVTDIQRDAYNVFKENNIFNIYFDRMVDEVGYLPDDLKRILYKNYVIIDHGFFFSEGVRSISIYTNLKNIPEELTLGNEVDMNTKLGLINNDDMDVLSMTLLNDSNGDLKAQKNIVNFEIYFQKEGINSYLGKGVDLENDPLYFDELFK